MKRIILVILFLFSVSNAHGYTINFSACDTTGEAFVWDEANGYGECVDLETLYYILADVAAVNTADTATYPLLVESPTGNLYPKTSTSLSFDASTGKLSSTSFDASATASPALTFKDSDCAGSNKEIAQVTANATTVTSGSEDGSVSLKVKVNGTQTTALTAAASTGTDTTATTVTMYGRRVPITSSIDRVIQATELYDGRFISTGASRWSLFDVSSAGYSGCLFASTANIVRLDPHSDDQILIPDSGTLALGQAYISDGNQGEFVCFESISSSLWLVTSKSAGWTGE